MQVNFDIKNTKVLEAFTLTSFPLIKYAKLLSWIFFVLFVGSIMLIGLSFVGVLLAITAVRICIVSLFFFLLFFQIHLFSELKIKRYQLESSLTDAILNPEYNLAEFLSLNACQMIQSAIQISKKSKLSQVSSEVLFYASLKNKDCSMLIYRLGVNIPRLADGAKNYLEKQPRQQKFNSSFSDSFLKVMAYAAKIAVERDKSTITEKEILLALAKHDKFFKKVLVEYDLKEKDVENITLWLDNLEEKIKKSKQFWTLENLARHGSLGRDFAAGFTPTLDRFAMDLTKIASKNIFKEIIGHQKEINEVEIALTKASQSNVLIIGDPGVGKKSIVEALAQRCFLKTGLDQLHGKKVMMLDMVALVSQIQDTEKLETTVDQIFEEALEAGNIILVIDQLDRFVEQKTQKAGEIDISGILAKYVALANFHFIGLTSFEGLHQKLERNSSFLQYFRKIEVSEVSEIETIRILQDIALQMEQKHKILIIYPTIREIINLTGRYFPNAPFPKKAIDVLDEAGSYIKALKEKVIEPHHIAKIISDKTQIPIGKMEFKEKSVLLNLENLIHQRIVGQDEAVNEIAIAMRRARSGLSSKKRPMGVFLFLGPTGVGKTETAKALAQIYFNGEEKMIRLDMSEFQAVSDIPRLIGQGASGEEQGLLTTPVRENPFSLVLLDEVEKAHPNILNLFLQVFDEGYITDGQGRKIIFTNTIIICTSNAGANMIFQAAKQGEALERDNIFEALFTEKTFKPEFINRFDAAVFFHPLSKENLMDIAQLNLIGLQKNLKEKDINFTITESLKEKIVELSYKPEFGAREMRRVVQDKIENIIAQALISDTIIKGDSIEINPENFEIIKL